jgi:uncharacterized protein YceK
MKIFEWSKTARVFVLVICLTVLSGASVSAQNNSSGGGATQQTRVERDNDTDWGWLGLLGLLGLAGLIPRKRNVEVHDNNRTTAR